MHQNCISSFLISGLWWNVYIIICFCAGTTFVTLCGMKRGEPEFGVCSPVRVVLRREDQLGETRGG